MIRDKGSIYFIGFDNNDNTYWQAMGGKEGEYRDIIYIYSKYGEAIDIFYWRGGRARVSPTGDIFYQDEGRNGIFYYRIKRRWGLDQETVQTKAAITIRPASITASSTLNEPTDRNAYSPAKVFDAKPETGWMEKNEGPGIGEWVKISFDRPVSADKLMVSPGYFDSRYWKENNRIRRLLISLDTYTQFVDFTDNMTTQEVSLGKARTFSTATFTIVEVYKTSHWDDTAIAEIEFWNAGRKLEIDLSGFEDRLKIVPE